MCGLVDTGTYELTLFVLPPHHHDTRQHTVDAAKAFFFDLWQPCSIMISLPAVWDSLSSFFSPFDQTLDNMF